MAPDPIDQLTADCRRLMAADRRALIGLVGVPGSGKSTLAALLAEAVNATAGPPESEPARVLPMDGFHLTNAELEAHNLRERKGSPPTFHADRLAALLNRLRAHPAETVTAPLYCRERHEPIPDAIAIGPDARLIIVEGNYLLLDQPPWDRIRPPLDEVWFLDVPTETAMQRVRNRHLQGGRTEAEADRKIAINDRPNAERVEATRPRADRIIDLG